MSSRVITGYKVNKRGRRVPIYGTSNSADEVKKAETKSTVTKSAETIKDKTKTKQKKTGPSGPSGGRVKKGGVLRYPYQALTANTDYLQIDIIEYKSVKQSSGSLISNPSSGNRRLTSAAANCQGSHTFVSPIIILIILTISRTLMIPSLFISPRV